jgi:hypothetical protein
MVMNIEMLEKVKTFLREEPRRLNMTEWVSPSYEVGTNAPPCGTVCCIAGATLLLATNSHNFVEFAATTRPWSVEKQAREVLGLSVVEARDLFYTAFWPEDLLRMYNDADDDKATQVEMVCKRIDRLVSSQPSLESGL